MMGYGARLRNLGEDDRVVGLGEGGGFEEGARLRKGRSKGW